MKRKIHFKCPVMRMAGREYRQSGENPGRYRRCVRIGWLLVDESQSLRNWEGREANRNCMVPVRKSEDLLGGMLCLRRWVECILLQEIGCGSLWAAAVFAFEVKDGDVSGTDHRDRAGRPTGL